VSAAKGKTPMTMFGSLVNEIQTKANGDSGRPVAARGDVPDTPWMRTLLETVGRYVNRKTKILEARIAEMESRLEQFTYAGVWQVSAKYQRGNFCSHDGSLWHCNVNSSCGVKPGSDPSHWTLCVKRGKDGQNFSAEPLDRPRLPTAGVRR
jgi:hypothetical protein